LLQARVIVEQNCKMHTPSLSIHYNNRNADLQKASIYINIGVCTFIIKFNHWPSIKLVVRYKTNVVVYSVRNQVVFNELKPTLYIMLLIIL